MYLLYTDESNLNPSSGDFFVYAGTAVPGGEARNLSLEIDRLRVNHGYRPGDALKFNTRERPSHISADVHRELKREVLGVAASHGVRLFSSFILHSVAKSPQVARRNEINRLCYHFDCYLRRMDDAGLVLIDSFLDKGLIGTLREKFSVGIRGFPYTPTYRLDRIVGIHVASIGTSHFASLVDLVVGSLRYAVNAREDPASQEVARVLVRQLAPFCIVDAQSRAEEISVFFSPKTIKVPRYLDKYLGLRDFFSSAGIQAQQTPLAG